MDKKQRLLSLYEVFPFHEHPFWQGIFKHDFTLEQVIRAEIQHYLRTKAGQTLRRGALEQARGFSPGIFQALLETYLEECTDKSGPSHLELIKRLLVQGSVTENDLLEAKPTPGNSCAIALYRDITIRGAGCHMLGAGAVEYYYCQICPKIYKTYVEIYGMSEHQAETYRIHGPMDLEHANRAFRILDEAVRLHGWPTIEQSVGDAFVATSMHYDGMLQAALGKIAYWEGHR